MDTDASDDGAIASDDAGQVLGNLSRRHFLGLSAVLGAGLVVPALVQGCASTRSTAGTRTLSTLPIGGSGLKLAPAADTFRHSPTLERFVQPLRGVYPIDPNGIPVAVPDGKRSYLKGRLIVDHYTIDINQYMDKLHPALGATTLWGFHSVNNLGGAVPQRHLGGILVGEKGKPIQITFRNKLPNAHPLPVDTGIMGANAAKNRTCVHLHGGLLPWTSDGGPFAWFSPDNGDGQPVYGPSADKGKIYQLLEGPKPGVGEAEFYYPNDQSARFMWYHDHAIGITRLNAYAGIASAMIIRDDFERSLVTSRGLPDFIEKGGREIPLVFQEKVFVDKDLSQAAPSSPDYYPGNARTEGSLWYPFRYDTGRWATDPGKKPDHLPISAIPEMFGDAMLTNGVVYPKASIEPRRYRLRILNATQARFLNLQLYVDNGVGKPDFTKPGPDFLVIGTEGGFLFQAATIPSGKRLKVTTGSDESRSVDPADPGGSLLTAPGERWDVIVDFSGFEGKNLIVYNDAPAPFPGGAPENDGTIDGKGVLLNQMIMRFDVGTTVTAPPDTPLSITPALSLGRDPGSGLAAPPAGIGTMTTTAPVNVPPHVKVRDLTLNEIFDDQGRLIQMLGTNKLRKLPPGFSLPVDSSSGLSLGARQSRAGPMDPAMGYGDAPTETPSVGDIEVWRIANLTSDVHPMHFHLVNCVVLSRQPFTGYEYDHQGLGYATGLGDRRGPDATELGWKETVKMNPGEVTVVIMKFEFAPVPFKVPQSPRTGGNEYVWHCHILEHEEHDMMRPLVVHGAHPQLL